MYDPSREYTTSVLVLGVTGAIGRAVARDLIVNGYRVYGLVRNIEDRSRLPYGVVGVVGDLRAPERWEVAVERTQIVVNCAFPQDLAGGAKTYDDAERDAQCPGGRRERAVERWRAPTNRVNRAQFSPAHGKIRQREGRLPRGCP